MDKKPYTSVEQFIADLKIYTKSLIKQEKYKSLAISWGYKTEERKENESEIIITSNASFAKSGSFGFINDVKEFIDQQKCLKEIISATDTIHIDFSFMDNNKETVKTSDSGEGHTLMFLPIKPKYSFEQIILEKDVRQEIMSAMKVLECKDLIYNIWGFGEIEPAPKSIINMYGEPGTGKTMCAHAIANYLGKDLLSLNYAEIESKYVGEAPKNLMAAFDCAKEKDCVLFFDEADSFLGKRIQNVTSGSEQALNSLRSQMLILLEEYSGVVLFATNLVTNFDKAFESRILKHIRFELPNIEARVEIIKKHIPSRLPINSPITNEQFVEVSAQIEGFSGREIKSAILGMLLNKADICNPNVIFSFDDLRTAMIKKKEEKENLKAEDNKLLKEKITKKLKEKAIEAEANSTINVKDKEASTIIESNNK